MTIQYAVYVQSNTYEWLGAEKFVKSKIFISNDFKGMKCMCMLKLYALFMPVLAVATSLYFVNLVWSAMVPKLVF